MDFDETCPPYWPQLLWHLRNGRPIPLLNPPDPDPWKEELFAGLAIYELAALLSDDEARRHIRRGAMRQVEQAVALLVQEDNDEESESTP